jgi:hypothetical protein
LNSDVFDPPGPNLAYPVDPTRRFGTRCARIGPERYLVGEGSTPAVRGRCEVVDTTPATIDSPRGGVDEEAIAAQAQRTTGPSWRPATSGRPSVPSTRTGRPSGAEAA